MKSIQIEEYKRELWDSNKGINFNTGKLADLVELGIIDPVRVTRCAVQNAASVASTLITTNHAIIEG